MSSLGESIQQLEQGQQNDGDGEEEERGPAQQVTDDDYGQKSECGYDGLSERASLLSA